MNGRATSDAEARRAARIPDATVTSMLKDGVKPGSFFPAPDHIYRPYSD